MYFSCRAAAVLPPPPLPLTDWEAFFAKKSFALLLPPLHSYTRSCSWVHWSSSQDLTWLMWTPICLQNEGSVSTVVNTKECRGKTDRSEDDLPVQGRAVHADEHSKAP